MMSIILLLGLVHHSAQVTQMDAALSHHAAEAAAKGPGIEVTSPASTKAGGLHIDDVLNKTASNAGRGST